MVFNVRALTAAVALLLCCMAISAPAASLQSNFQSPPDSARPWVYWFWLNGNITREGITADLEAMKRVGIGGVLIMEVDQGSPVGPVGFMSPEWRELFKHVVSEAQRLGLEVNMNNDAGWNGSGGPWIKPEQSMQKVVWSETEVAGSQHFDGKLKRPETVAKYYRDITVLAFPTPGTYRIPLIGRKAGYEVGQVSASVKGNVPRKMVVDSNQILDISSHMDHKGRLVWDAPPGKWTVMRFGHTSTGAVNSPAPTSGRGLECDKLSKEGAEAAFNGMMGKLIADVGPLAGKALAATHVDSWENGGQNWTTRMREEFLQRRKYDMMPFLPVMTGRVVDSLDVSERFLWDLRQTISELVIENYAGHLRDLAHAGGLRFTTEAYMAPCDSIPYGGQADEPMGEFWTYNNAVASCRLMASAGHTYGKPIIGAEAFTSFADERWRAHPATIKALGDTAFCEGINRFVFHRYAMQPWVTPERKPGMMMGPWGVHYERTQTWWDQSVEWHNYLARCQYMLRQGLFVADACYVHQDIQSTNQLDAQPTQTARKAKGYDWDECGPEVVLTRMSVKDGRITLPDGMSYRLLVLPETRAMTLDLLKKIGSLVQAGATVVGPKPLRDPSLTGYPDRDNEVRRVADELWGDCDGKTVKEHRFGKGLVVWGKSPAAVLAESGIRPDLTSKDGLDFIHRTVDGTEIYFVANPKPYGITSAVSFRIEGKVPELWWPDTGRIERANVYEEKNGATRVALPLGPSGSVFVVFREVSPKVDPIVAVKIGSKRLIAIEPAPPIKIVLQRATYGILSDPKRTRDVTSKARKQVEAGKTSIQVGSMAQGDDPALGIVKTLVLNYTVNGRPATLSGTDPETVDLLAAVDQPLPSCELKGDGQQVNMLVRHSGTFTIVRASGRKTRVAVVAVPKPLPIKGPWTLSFPPNWGAPDSIKLLSLLSWSKHPNAGVKYFSGTAIYHTTFDVPKNVLGKGLVTTLNLGEVQVIAQVKLNGKDLGTLWKRPFTIDVTNELRPGKNQLEVKVTNLWPNRLIGDEQLPEDSDRRKDGTLKSWPNWVQVGKPSPTGRYTFSMWRLWGKNEPLLRSGLLGPVTLHVAREVRL